MIAPPIAVKGVALCYNESMLNHTVLTKAELASALHNLDDWSVQNGEVCAEFTFHDFTEAIDFIKAVADVAEEMNHHPGFCNAYNKVSFSFCTHDVGNEITDTDINMAAKISDTARSFHHQ